MIGSERRIDDLSFDTSIMENVSSNMLLMLMLSSGDDDDDDDTAIDCCIVNSSNAVVVIASVVVAVAVAAAVGVSFVVCNDVCIRVVTVGVALVAGREQFKNGLHDEHSESGQHAMSRPTLQNPITLGRRSETRNSEHNRRRPSRTYKRNEHRSC